MTQLLSHILQDLPLFSRPMTSPIKNFRSCIQLSKRCQKLKILTFKVNFLCQKISESFQKKISLKNIILGAHFLLLTFFENFYF